jgi:hypothetical protein
MAIRDATHSFIGTSTHAYWVVNLIEGGFAAKKASASLFRCSHHSKNEEPATHPALPARISHRLSAAAANPGMAAALHLLRFFDVLPSTPAEPSVALANKRQLRPGSKPVCAALR